MKSTLCIIQSLLTGVFLSACGSTTPATVQSVTQNKDGTTTTSTVPYIDPCAQARADAVRNLFKP